VPGGGVAFEVSPPNNLPWSEFYDLSSIGMLEEDQSDCLEGGTPHGSPRIRNLATD
jgi:hypothetical protein